MTDNLSQALVVQGRTLRALILRELSTYQSDSRLGFLWSLFRPLAVMTVLYIVLSGTHRTEVQGMPVLLFLATGYLFWINFEYTFIYVERSAFADSVLRFPQITPLDVAITFTFVQWITNMLAGVIVLIAALVLDGDPFPDNAFVLFVVYCSTTLLAASVGLIVVCVGRFIHSLPNFINPIRRVGVLISGAEVPMSILSPDAQKFFSWNPLVHQIEIARHAWYPAYVSPIADPVFVFVCGFGLLLAGLLFERATRRRAE